MISATNTDKNIQELFRRSRQQEEESQLNQKMEETVAEAKPFDMAGAETLQQQDAQRQEALGMVDAGLGDASVGGPPAPTMRQSGEGLDNPSYPVDQEGNRLPQSPAARSDAQGAYNKQAGEAFAGKVTDAVGFMGEKVSDATTRATELAGKVAGSQAVTDLVDSAEEHVDRHQAKEQSELQEKETNFNLKNAALEVGDGKGNMRTADASETEGKHQLIYDYLVRTRGPGFKKIFETFEDFENRMSEVGFETSEDIESFLQSTGLRRLGSNESAWNGTGEQPAKGSPGKGSVVTEQDMDLLGDMKAPESEPRPDYQNTRNRVAQNNRQRGPANPAGAGGRFGSLEEFLAWEREETKRERMRPGSGPQRERDAARWGARDSELSAEERWAAAEGKGLSKNEQNRESNDVSLEGSPDAFRQNPGVINVKGNLVYDPSEKGPKRRTYGGTAEKIMQNKLLELYQEPGKNHRDIVDITRHLAHRLGIPASQFPDDQADAMLAKEVLNHISRFGGAEDRSIAKMLAEGDNPWYQTAAIDPDTGEEIPGEQTWVAGVPRDGRDGVAQTGDKAVAEQVFNPMTGQWEVRRSAERREGDNRRAGRTQLTKQLESGNFPVENYIDQEGNWLKLDDERTGQDQFIDDYAAELGISRDANGELDFSKYTGRGANQGAAGFRAEISYFLDMMNRNQSLQRQNQMRGQQQNERSPTLGPQIMNDSLAQATTDAEKFEIAARFNNLPLMKFYQNQLNNQNEVDVTAAGAGDGDGGASGLMAKSLSSIDQKVGTGDIGGADAIGAMLFPNDPIKSAQVVAASSIKQGQGHSMSNPAVMNLAQQVARTMQPSFDNDKGNKNWSQAADWAAGAMGFNTYEDLTNDFVDEMSRLLPGTPEEFLDEQRKWFHENILKTTEKMPEETQVGEPEVRGGGDGKTEPKGGMSSSSKKPNTNPRANANANKNTP